MTHTHYIATPVSEPPTKSGWYHTEFTDDDGNKLIGRAHWNNDVQFFQSQAYHDGSKVLVETWLKPCTETPGILGKFIAAIRKEFPDQNWEYLDFIAERVLGDCTETGAVDAKALLEWMRKHVDDEDTDGYCLPEGKWLYIGRNLNPQIVTFEQLLEIFKAETQKTREEINEGNKLIAEWMGYKSCGRQVGLEIFTSGGGDITFITDFKYHKDWNKLMPVVEKIENLKSSDSRYLYSIDTGRDVCIIGHNDIVQNTIANQSVSGNKLLSIYKAVVQFIKWYNTQPK